MKIVDIRKGSVVMGSALVLVGIGAAWRLAAGSRDVAKAPQSEASRREQQEFGDAVTRGRKAVESNNPKTASYELETALTLRPRSPEGHRWLALAYEKQGRVREALAEYRAVIEDPNGLPSSYRSDPRVLVRYGDLCVKAGETEHARFAYALAAIPPPVLPPESPGHERERRDLMFKRQRPQRSVLLWRTRTKSLARLRSKALHAAGRKDLLSGRPVEAAESLQQAVGSDGTLWEARRDLGMALFRIGKPDEAEKQLQVAARSARGKDRASIMRLIDDLGGSGNTVLRLLPNGASTTTYERWDDETL